jgi:citrate synthase
VCAESGKPARYDLALQLESAAVKILGPKGIYPNVDFFSGIIYEALGIPRDLFTPIFAIARVTGWLSHWLEQLRNNRIFRPEQIFTGVNDKPYLPIDQRP